MTILVKRWSVSLLVTAIVMVWCTSGFAQKPQGSMLWNFEHVPVGSIPSGWKIEATGNPHPLATWKVVLDPTAPSGTKVLSLTDVNHHSWSTFNLCWTDKVSFLNGEISVKLRANSGRIDEGGGIIWRVQDHNNYYVARFNPLENNFRLYYVKNGIRRQLASAYVHFPKGQWITMRIVQDGNRIVCYLNNQKFLEKEAHVFNTPGGVGLWTKADAATSFDDFEVRIAQ